ncbi:hypothetical protein IPZ61_01355 [Streptomyces sioyaensis]|nr:hypothetical protein [Streptomyces sioyaensis]
MSARIRGREAAGEDLAAEQVGEWPGPVGAQPAPRAVGGDGGRGAVAGVVSDAVGGRHGGDHIHPVGIVMLLECCAT